MLWCSGGLYIIPPSRVTPLFRSDHTEIKGFWDCTVIGCFVQVVPLLRFGARVAGRGVAASAGALIHVTVLSYLEGGLLGRSGWLQQVSQWAGLRARPIGMRGHTVVCFWRIGIPYKYPVFAGRDSFDNTPGHFSSPLVDVALPLLLPKDLFGVHSVVVWCAFRLILFSLLCAERFGLFCDTGRIL